jgi:pyridoxine 5-phosphate synthase
MPDPVRLGVNVDHIATVREARKGQEPDPVVAAALAEMAGADGITVHLRSDRRHIQDRDLELLRKTVQTRLNLEAAATPQMTTIASTHKPDQVTLVPERREEITTEGGLDVLLNQNLVKKTAIDLREAGIRVSRSTPPSIPRRPTRSTPTRRPTRSPRSPGPPPSSGSRSTPVTG